VPLFSGRILLPDGVEEGWVEVEGGRLLARGDGEPPARPDGTGWIVPAPVNAHTHAADTFLREVPGKPRTVPELVGPRGWKHARLREAQPGQVEEGIRRYAQEMARLGTSAFLDFREGGPAGAQLLRGLAPDLPVPPVVLGRPALPGFSEEEAHALLAAADGVGLSALRDFPRRGDVEAWAEACRRARKPFALHASEAVREDVEAVLALEPSFLVHLTRATPRDLRAVADAQVPVVVCPRSNAWYGLRTPVEAMRAAGVTLAVGTDNGMLHDGDLLAELGLLRALDPGAADDELLRMACWNGRALAGLPPPLPRRAGEPVDLVVLPERPVAAAETRPGFAVGP
jgi:cytosine/adenosine deaminase-related metal-dependent hydrolase